MSVLTFKSDEFKTFPPVIREYASYTAVIKGNSEKTVCDYLLDLRTFFRYYLMQKEGQILSQDEFEDISISSIKESDIKEVSTQLIVDYLMFAGFERNNSPTTRMRKLCAIKSFFQYAYARRHIIDANPAVDIDAPKKSKTLPKYLTVEESIRLLEAVRTDISSKTVIRDFAIVTLFLNTGMRLSELVGLNLDSFDSELNKVVVFGKGSKERVIYLNDACQAALTDYLITRMSQKYAHVQTKAVFLSRLDQRMSVKTVQAMVYKYLKLAGLESKHYSVHKLRHTAATLMYQSGNVDVRVLKEILGHEQLNTTQIYTHVSNADIEKAMEQNPLATVKSKK